MGKRSQRLEEHSSSDEKHDAKRVKREKKVKKEKKDKKEKNEKKDKKAKKEIDVEEGSVPNGESKPLRDFALHDLISIEHAISNIQINLKKIIDDAPNAQELSRFINNLVEQSAASGSEQNGDITAKILLFAKSQRIQLASQLKSLHEDGKFALADQIANFDGQTQLKTGDNVQLLLKKKRQEAIAKESISAPRKHELLPNIPVLYDSVLESKVFVHKSATNNDLHSTKYDQVQANNERLEFLGDAVLETAISDVIDSRYPSFDEGELSRLRSVLVKNETLEILARAYRLPERQQELMSAHIIKTELDTNANFKHNKKVADLLEAYIGALFMDRNKNGKAYDYIKEWISEVYEPILDDYDNSDRLSYSHMSNPLVSSLLKDIDFTSQKSSSQDRRSLSIQAPTTNTSTNANNIDYNAELATGKEKLRNVLSKTETLPEDTKFPIKIKSSEEIDKQAKATLYALIGTAKLHPVYSPLANERNFHAPCVVQCQIGEDILGYGEGSNFKEASARAAKASLMNKKMVEKYHLIRMMTPREESVVRNPALSDSKEKDKPLDTSSKPRMNPTEFKIKSGPQLAPEPEITKTGIREPPKIAAPALAPVPHTISPPSEKKETVKYLKTPYFITSEELSNPDNHARTRLMETLGAKDIFPQFVSVIDTSKKSVLPLYRTSLKVNGKEIASCVEASKKKGCNKVAAWLMSHVVDHGVGAIVEDLQHL